MIFLEKNIIQVIFLAFSFFDSSYLVSLLRVEQAAKYIIYRCSWAAKCSLQFFRVGHPCSKTFKQNSFKFQFFKRKNLTIPDESQNTKNDTINSLNVNKSENFDQKYQNLIEICQFNHLKTRMSCTVQKDSLMSSSITFFKRLEAENERYKFRSIFMIKYEGEKGLDYGALLK